ncbi:MAG: tetratricopeptide repeat protein [Syntrophorhabdaceae bacterium]|nr:tetratricopeptide repeat protein [Syntrophorhabdaceae bacterium]
MYKVLIRSHRAKTLFLIFIIIVITAISFFPVLKNGFTNWDDEGHVVKNPYIKTVSIKELFDFKSPLFFANYIPLTALTYMLEYRCFGLNPKAYHTTNLLIHLINTVLVFIFVYLISNNLFVSSSVSLLFGIHPMHVESVAWVSERKDVLYTVFFMLSLITYLIYGRDNSRKGVYILSLFLYLLSLLSKPMAVSLPFVLFLIDYILNRGWKYKIYLEKLPFLLITIPFFSITLSLQDTAISPEVALLFPDNLLFLSYRILFYFIKLILPVHLSAFYPYPQKVSQGLPFIFVFSLFIVIISFSIVTIFYKKIIDKRDTVFGILFFFMTIFPVIQIVPIGRTIVSDRYTYVPYIGLFYVLSLWLYKIFDGIKRRGRWLKLSMMGLTIFVISTLSYLTWERCHVWKDSVTLWSDVIEKYPEAVIAYNNRALSYTERGEYQLAIKDYRKALTIDPDDYTTHTNICSLFIKMGDLKNAYMHCSNAIKLKPEPYDALNGLGTIFFHIKDYKKALIYYRMAVNMNPLFAQAYYNLCSTYQNMREFGLAIEACNRAIEIKPDYVEAYINLGSIFLSINDYKRAVQFYKHALEIDPDFPPTHNNLSVVYYYMGYYDLAEFHYRKAIKLGYNVHPEISEMIEGRGRR